MKRGRAVTGKQETRSKRAAGAGWVTEIDSTGKEWKVRTNGGLCDGCDKVATYGYENDKRLRCKSCGEGATPPMHKIILRKYCWDHKTRMTYGDPINRKRLACEQCAEHDTMIDLNHKPCEDCKTVRPSYGERTGKARWCKPCSLQYPDLDIINRVDTLCEDQNCDTRAIFGYIWQKPLTCIQHIKSNMTNVKDPKCKCGQSQQRFGFRGMSPECCSLCKEPNMVNLKDPMCHCGIYATYGKADAKAVACSDHRTETMVDRRHPLCPCGTRPSYGYRWHRPISCFYCKDDKMDNVLSARCGNSSCKKHATHRMRGEPVSKCARHKLPGMEHARYVQCPFPNCNIPFWKGYGETLCETCRVDHTNWIPRKEQVMAKFLRDTYPDCDWVHNRESADDRYVCGKWRPDFLLRLPSHNIHVEVDEYQHTHNTIECELSRTVDVFTGTGCVPSVFIRFNTDGFRSKFCPSGIVATEARYRFLKTLLDGYINEPLATPMITLSFLFYSDTRVEKMKEEIESGVCSHYFTVRTMWPPNPNKRRRLK